MKISTIYSGVIITIFQCLLCSELSIAQSPAEKLAAHGREFQQEVIEVTSGVYVAIGYALEGLFEQNPGAPCKPDIKANQHTANTYTDRPTLSAGAGSRMAHRVRGFNSIPSAPGLDVSSFKTSEDEGQTTHGGDRQRAGQCSRRILFEFGIALPGRTDEEIRRGRGNKRDINKSQAVKQFTLRNLEIIAIPVSVVMKFILMDWLKLRGVYITGISIFWIWYLFYRVKTIPNILHIWGFKSSGFRQSFLFLLPFVILSIVACILYAVVGKTFSFSWHVIPILFLYPIWGTIQQFLMLGIISQNLNTFLKANIHQTVTVIIISILFSLIHYPSFFLMIITFCIEILFVIVYNKWRNLWAIGLAHGWVATFLLFYVLERDLWLELFFRY